MVTHGQPVTWATWAASSPASAAGGCCSARRSIQLMIGVSGVPSASVRSVLPEAAAMATAATSPGAADASLRSTAQTLR
ncbi:MAG: hypothetical protein BWZ02_02653 [Lentisphaerae bacterium ADurb.BinA184]|nr:MAG: hypothetical protein BWZ02_02653 [Lentisphaerae bacterium ADurb.BinA184]